MEVAEVVRVRLSAKQELQFGEDMLVCGSVAAMGGWSLADALPMTWDKEESQWNVEIALPCGVRIEFKLVIRRQAGVEWVGAGPGGASNIAMTTSLGRQGAQETRFLVLDIGLPFGLSVADVGFGHAEPPPPAGGDHAHQLALPGGGPAPPAHAQQAPVANGPQGASPESLAAMKFAAAAAQAGHQVSYTTTTVTTVTLGGDAGQAPTSHVPGQNGMHHNNGHNGHNAIVGVSALANGEEDDSPKAPDCAAAMRDVNPGVPVLGRVTLVWQESSASEVKVAGSWDSWKRQLQLVPTPTGFGAALALPPGCYECKFIVDSVWKSSGKMPSCGRDGNNYFEVEGNLLAPMLPEEEAVPAPPPGGVLALCVD
eukprot:TRINITY_DN44809_c0_g1_i1.p1 TRINITY_DN44809_c0_g1~~TRINITY_DN44809_c0_g1_i1.p1  ORF type:complete len:407 (+),score=111.30 TRINITY_DN44809_c0_g1_i1:117-1223(+)